MAEVLYRAYDGATLKVGDYVRWNHEEYGEPNLLKKDVWYTVSSTQYNGLFTIHGSDWYWTFTKQFVVREPTPEAPKVDYLSITRDLCQI